MATGRESLGEEAAAGWSWSHFHLQTGSEIRKQEVGQGNGPSLFSVASINTKTKSNLGRSCLASTSGSQSIIPWSQGRNASLLPWFPMFTFFIQARPICLEVALPILNWALPQQSLVKKVFPRYALRPICWSHFFSWGSFTQVSPVCQTDKKT